MKTIFALASAPGQSGIAVIRLSGPAAGAALVKMSGRKLPPARLATRVNYRHPVSLDVIDHGLSLWFPGPESYTGEDVAEFHVHGGRAICDAMTGALLAIPGLRLAEPGEFTRRAFEHGKMDLTEAEAVADLIDAETEAQRRQALRQLDGGLGTLYEDWRARLLHSTAHLEAWIDFPDEDLPDDVIASLGHDINQLGAEIDRHLCDGGRGERLRQGIHIAIIGDPNVGKSTLLNLLAGRNAAIISSQAGTTRDVIEIALDIGGFPVILADTAGLRDGVGEIEREGVRRAVERAASADLKIIMLDSRVAGESAVRVAEFIDRNSLVVINKIDLGPVGSIDAAESYGAVQVSLKTGENISQFLGMLERLVADRFDTSPHPSLTRARHRTALDECRAALHRAGAGDGLELQAEDLRLAVRALGRITGRVDVEDLLDVIFGDFCIGK